MAFRNKILSRPYKMFLALLLSLFLLVSASWEDPIVETGDGKLRGRILKDFDGNDFFSFQSIPFAKPPVGEERFKDPKPAEKWTGVRNATEDMPLCFQWQNKGIFKGVEDCLYLNVHTPEITIENVKPVMVFIHGGCFTEGNGRYDLYGPEFLMTAGVVLVTINYRLGFFGFLNFDKLNVDIPGNAGLKDQVMALKWVKKNIRNFGGDPDNVTIFGESAGGASVHLHVLSPASQGLFHKAISMSGVAVSIWNGGTQNNGVLMARRLGYEGEDEMEMVKLLRDVDDDQIKALLDNPPFLLPTLFAPTIWGATIEREHDNAFITDTPRNLLKKGDFNKVPFMLGYTDQDGMVIEVFYRLKVGAYEPWTLDWYVPKFFNLSESQRESLTNEIDSFYFKNGRTAQANLDLGTDSYFAWSTYEAVFGHMKHGQDVFLYVFSSDTKMNRLKLANPTTAKYRGACHMDELGHLFTSSFMPQVAKGSIEDKSIRLTVDLFTNFAKDGHPTREGADVQWTKTNPHSLNYIEITNDKIKLGYAPDKERERFWTHIFKKYSPETEIFCGEFFK